MSERMKCDAVVWKRDQLRVCRDGSGRKFRMHYNKCRCKRWATHGDLCRQHAEMPGISKWSGGVSVWERDNA